MAMGREVALSSNRQREEGASERRSPQLRPPMRGLGQVQALEPQIFSSARPATSTGASVPQLHHPRAQVAVDLGINTDVIVDSEKTLHIRLFASSVDGVIKSPKAFLSLNEESDGLLKLPTGEALLSDLEFSPSHGVELEHFLKFS